MADVWRRKGMDDVVCSKMVVCPVCPEQAGDEWVRRSHRLSSSGLQASVTQNQSSSGFPMHVWSGTAVPMACL